MTADIGQILARELGHLVVTALDRLEPYGRDESGLGVYPPAAVVRPTTPEELRIALRQCVEHRVPVTPRGAGTGKSGGALPVQGGVVVSLEQMQKIYEIDLRNQLAVVEPGVVTGTLQAAVEAQGLYYPPDPASLDTCTIGGNVAENAGGPRAYRYGVTRDFVLGLEVALMGGDRLALGRRSPKGVSGYDLTALLVGSEGTLAVIDRVTLRLLPKPRQTLAALAVFPALGAAGEAVVALTRAGIRPATLELMDRVAIDHVRPGSAYRFPEGAEAVLLMEVDGSGSLEALEQEIRRCGEACEQSGATDLRIAQDEAQRRRLWEARRQVSERLDEAHRRKASDDIAVPLGEMPAMIARIKEIGDEHGLLTGVYGHAGDGNLHVNLLSDEPDDAQVDDAFRQARIKLFHETLHRGGTLSGEHGIGLAKRDFMILEHPPQELEMMRAIKQLWDPHGLLNPGKLIPVDDQ